MGRQYTTDNLQPGDKFVIRGKLAWPKLTHVIDGQELQDEIRRNTQAGRIPVTEPHTLTTLVDAYVEVMDPGNPTLAERYANERLYVNKDGRTCYSAVRKSNTLAQYTVVDPNDPNKATVIYLDPDKQVANDIEVRCFFRVFATKAGMHNGISLDSIMFMEPVRYYEFNNADESYQAMGITVAKAEGPAPNPHVTPAYGNNIPQPQVPPMVPPMSQPNGMIPPQGIPVGQPQVPPMAPPMGQPQMPPIGQPNAYGGNIPQPQVPPMVPPMGQPQIPPIGQPQVPPMGQPNGMIPPQGIPVGQPQAPTQQIGNTNDVDPYGYV